MTDDHLITGDNAHAQLVTEFGMLCDAIEGNLSSHSVQQWYVMLNTLQLRVRDAYWLTRPSSPMHQKWLDLHGDVLGCLEIVSAIIDGLFPDLGSVLIPWTWDPVVELRTARTRILENWCGGVEAEQDIDYLIELARRTK